MLVAQILPNAAKSMAIFAVLAFLLALAAGMTGELVGRLLIELPLLLLVTAVCTLVIDLIASAVGTILGGVSVIAAVLAFLLGWAIAGDESQSFSGLGYHSLLKPAYAVALAAPWLLSFINQRG